MDTVLLQVCTYSILVGSYVELVLRSAFQIREMGSMSRRRSDLKKLEVTFGSLEFTSDCLLTKQLRHSKQ